MVANGVEVVFATPPGRAPRGAGDFEPLADGAHDLPAQLVLVGEVPVEGGRLDAQLPGEPAEGERRRALGVHECDRLLDDLVRAEPGALPPGTAAGRV